MTRARAEPGRAGAPLEERASFATVHEVVLSDARAMPSVETASVDLIVTSPPYPMIEMWDQVFERLSPAVAAALRAGRAWDAFEACHAALDLAWAECFRALRAGGIACVNVGDATRTIGGAFAIYPNHARVIEGMRRAGFTPLPDILWRKPTNAPNKFLGSGMLPAGAYVTYEHEYILIFRKGAPRAFTTPEARRARRRSAFFFEERNVWFSDVWMDLRGAVQELGPAAARARSGAFPFELAYRLVGMHSVAGDRVLDPFAGTGTTLAAAVAAGRSSMGVEIDPALEPRMRAAIHSGVAAGQARSRSRLDAHRRFVEARLAAGRPPKHVNAGLGVPVVTSQETELELPWPAATREAGPGRIEVDYDPRITASVPDVTP